MKSKKTKRALISSVLALVLCFVMLLGTTFAWFTDTASTKVNTIQAGKLDVALEDEDGNSLENGILSWQKNEQGKGQEVLWEPGATYNLQNVVIKNNGNLALKYKVVISGIEGDAKLNEAIDWTMKTNGKAVVQAEDEPEGSEGVSVQAEEAETVAYAKLAGEYYLLPDEEATLTISGTMKTTAGNEYQGLSIDGVAITVYATQYTYEYDSSNNTYDAGANFAFAWDGVTTTTPEKDSEGVYHITSAAQFVTYINAIHVGSGYKDVVLDADIDLGGYTIEVSGEGYAFSGSFDGQNHTVSNYVIKRTDGKNYTGLFSCYDWNGASVKNLTVKNGTVISNGAQVSAIIPSLNNENGVVDNCHAINCTVIGEKKVGAITGYVAYGTVSNCTATDCSVYASDNREDQASVFGYDNGGTFKDNTDDGSNTVNYNTGAVTTISTKAELFDFAESVNVSKNSYNGQTVVLTADIDLGNTPWTPIGDVTNQDKFFQGTFDGNGHTIYNLYVDMSSDSSTDYTTAGLFGWVDATNGGCTIKNLTIDGATVKGNHYTGAVVGFMTGTIDNCHVKNATIVSTYLDTENSGDKAGGVAGYLNANTKCTNCTVSDSTITAARDAGQVIGCLGKSATQSNNTAEEVTVSGNGVNIKNDVVGRDDNNT